MKIFVDNVEVEIPMYNTDTLRTVIQRTSKHREVNCALQGDAFDCNCK